MRNEPLRIEPYLTRDYINREQKLREIRRGLEEQEKYRGWKLVAWCSGMFFFSWALALLVIYGVAWVLQ